MKRLKMKMLSLRERVRSKLTDNSGQGAVDTAIIVLLSVVLGALLLAGLYALMDDTVLFSSSNKHDMNCYA